MDVVLTLSDVHPRDRLAYWYDVACKVFVDHECRVTTPAQFDVTMQHMALSDLGVVNIESLGLGFAEVTARTIANGEDDVFFLCLQLEGGATLSQDGREAVIEPGDFVLLDAQRPYSCRYTTNWRQIIIKIPHRSLNARLAASSELTACPVRSSTAVGGLTSGFIRMIPERVEVLQPVAKTQIAEHVLDLAALALAAETAKDKPALSSGRAIALLQLRVAIENRLGDPTLDPSSAAAAAGISVRYANVLLSEQGTSLQRFIVSRRLDHCRRALEDPMQAQRTITDIAFAWGFSDQSHFNRRFKAEYGCAPRDYRQRFRS
jgi:AraC-like DNA-binding protein